MQEIILKIGRQYRSHPVHLKYLFNALKVLTNEKRGGLKVEAFDRSPFKLFTLKFSNKSVQAPSCERH
jgi:hypothetical protein